MGCHDHAESGDGSEVPEESVQRRVEAFRIHGRGETVLRIVAVVAHVLVQVDGEWTWDCWGRCFLREEEIEVESMDIHDTSPAERCPCNCGGATAEEQRWIIMAVSESRPPGSQRRDQRRRTPQHHAGSSRGRDRHIISRHGAELKIDGD